MSSDWDETKTIHFLFQQPFVSPKRVYARVLADSSGLPACKEPNGVPQLLNCETELLRFRTRRNPRYRPLSFLIL